MIRKNLFDGESYHAMFAQITYKWFISRKWVTYADIMADYLGLKSAKELTCNVSNCDNYGELKKAFRDISNAIVEKVGEGCFEIDGNNRNKRFRYVGKDNDPLADMRNAKVINNLRQYWKFCQDSAGFFPKSWLEYFFKDCQDLLDIKAKRQKGEQVISASLDRILTNIEFLPSLYEAITSKTVLEIDYKPFDEEEVTLMFHPHSLKEYNGRWHLFGHAEGKARQAAVVPGVAQLMGQGAHVGEGAGEVGQHAALIQGVQLGAESAAALAVPGIHVDPAVFKGMVDEGRHVGGELAHFGQQLFPGFLDGMGLGGIALGGDGREQIIEGQAVLVA